MATNKISTPAAMALAILAERACIEPNCDCRLSLAASRGLTHCPAHHDAHPSLNITPDTDKCLWYCHAGCSQDDVTDALIALDLDAESFEGKAPKRDYRTDKGKLLAAWSWDHPQAPVAIYQYRDECGTVLYEKLRYQTKSDGSKQFAWRRGPVGHPATPSYYTRLGDVRMVPYRLPELLAADPAAVVLMVEGEKAADLLAAMGLVVTIYKLWLPDWNTFLTGRRILMLPDNDGIGEDYAAEAAKIVWPVAQEIRSMKLPGLPHGGDVFDFIEQGHGEVLLSTIRSL